MAAGARGDEDYTKSGMEGQLAEAKVQYCNSLRCAQLAPCSIHRTDLHVVLSTGAKMPILGFGTYQCPQGLVGACLEQAFKAGYRHIDCAEIYGNQKEIGAAFTKIFNDPKSGVKRQDIFITSKLWITDFRPESVRPALQKALTDLQLEYLDLYLMHIPVPCVKTPEGEEKAARRAGFALLDTWRVLEGAHAEGVVKAIGVSNFPAILINDFQNAAKVVPACNQIERHPYLSQMELVEFHRSLGIALTAFSPLGAPAEMGAKFAKVSEPLKNPVIQAIANKYGKTPAQVLLRWSIDSGIPVIPKSSTNSRIVENFDVFDFNLDAADMSHIAALDRGLRLFEQNQEGVPCFK